MEDKNNEEEHRLRKDKGKEIEESHITRHMPHVTYHMSHVINLLHNSNLVIISLRHICVAFCLIQIGRAHV